MCRYTKLRVFTHHHYSCLFVTRTATAITSYSFFSFVNMCVKFRLLLRATVWLLYYTYYHWFGINNSSKFIKADWRWLKYPVENFGNGYWVFIFEGFIQIKFYFCIQNFGTWPLSYYFQAKLYILLTSYRFSFKNDIHGVHQY